MALRLRYLGITQDNGIAESCYLVRGGTVEFKKNKRYHKTFDTCAAFDLWDFAMMLQDKFETYWVKDGTWKNDGEEQIGTTSYENICDANGWRLIRLVEEGVLTVEVINERLIKAYEQ